MERSTRKIKILMALLLFLIAVGGSSWKYHLRIYGAEADAQIVLLQDESGNYLKKNDEKWYLYSADHARLSGLQYLEVPKGFGISSGYYMFSKKGVLLQNKAVYYLEKQKVHDVTFKGYYYAGKNGRFPETPQIYSLSKLSCGSKVFNGLYYVGEHGKLSASSQIRYIRAQKVGKVSLKTGYYFFYKNGLLSKNGGFHKYTGTVNGKEFDGTYFFGINNGRLYTVKGWKTIKNQRYYLLEGGKRAENTWKSGYYLLSNGKIAYNQKVPGNKYVGDDGKRCSAAVFALNPLRKKLEGMIHDYSGSWSVYVKDLKTGGVINLNERSMYPASTIKAFVMATVFDQINQDKLKYTGSISNLLTDMITVSDNEAYNELVRCLGRNHGFLSGASVVNKYLSKNGYKNTSCHHTLHPSSSSRTRDGHSNQGSAKDCGVLLERIYQGKCVSKKYSKEMLGLLKRQQCRWKIPSGIPSGVTIANKTGETNSTQHDMAIVFGKKTDYILCVFSTTGEYNGVTGIRNISRTVYNYLEK